MAAVRHLEIFKVTNFNFPYPSEDHNASRYQILCRSVKPLRRYGRLTIFKMAAVRHLGFLKFWNFNYPYPSDGHNPSRYQNFVQIGQTVAEIWSFSIFQDGGRPPSWICYTPVWTTHVLYFGGLWHCAKFGLNRCSSFGNMQVLIFWALSLKMPIHATFLGVFGAKMGENGNFVYVYPSRNATHPVTRILMYNLSKSVQRFDP